MVQIGDLFTDSRFPGGVSGFMLVLYFPAGLILAVFRTIFCIQLLLVLSLLPKHNFIRSLILRVFGIVLGFVVTTGQREHVESNVKLFVSNHVSVFDCLAIETVQPVLQPYAACTYLPSFVCWLMDYICQKFSLERSLAYIRDNIEDFQQPVLTFPEEATTNGKNGLLKFNPSSVNLTNGPVQPIALYVSRPSTSRIAVSLIKENFWMDLFWTLFVPFTRYHISFLPVVTKTEDDSDEDFAKRLQRDIAYVLDLAVTPFSKKDKEEYVNKLYEETAHLVVKRKTNVIPSSADRRTEEMTRQVKHVFPQCPIEVIMKDIARTKDVNLTLTNILEGRVTYQPLNQLEQEEEGRKWKMTQQQSEKTEIVQEIGGQLSFQEKKRRMIAEARRKYLEKHPELEIGHAKTD